MSVSVREGLKWLHHVSFVVRGDTPALYTVLPEKSHAVGGAVMGSSHVYDLSAVS